MVILENFRTTELDFDSLYYQHNSYIYNTCLGILGNADDARDAAQETFVQFYKSLPNIKKHNTHRTWLYKVAINKCMDVLRKRRRCRQIECTEAFGDPQRSSDDRALEQQVRQAILKLKPDHRAVLVLFYFQQLSYTDISESLGWSMNQVRARLHRAKIAFRKVYDGGDPVEM